MLTKADQDYFINRTNRMIPAEAALYIGITLKTLAQWRYLRKGPAFIKVGQRVYYDRLVIDAWLKSRIHDFAPH